MKNRFDLQADRYDERAGIRDEALPKIVETIREMAGLTPDDSILEVAAGTGQIGYHLHQFSSSYTGIDISEPMLEQFRARCGGNGSTPNLVCRDAAETWPAKDRSTRLIFISRAVHLLDHEQFADECHRIASPAGAVLLTGSVIRPDDAPQVWLRSRMHELLRENGVVPRDRVSGEQAVIDCCVRHGGKSLAARTAAEWRVRCNPKRLIENWKRMRGLGGQHIDEDVKSRVLGALEVAANERFGALAPKYERETTVSYRICGVRLTGAPQ